ncbi:13039_t:CDS:2 [Entrophospora sp. SA101]|nr:13039_t:CDS:2 [Entrophospora sp. SA101]
MPKKAEKEKERKEARQHFYRLALRYLVSKKKVEFKQGKEKTKVLSKLFGDLGKKYQTRPGGYSRIIKLGQRQGDNNLRLDRVLAGAMVYPEEYGFIPETLDEDGDPLDVICLTIYPVSFPCYVPIRIIGVLRMIDGGEADDKLLAVNAVEPRLENINDLKDVSQAKLAEINHFFLRYKELEKKKVELKGFQGKKKAEEILKKCQNLYKKQQQLKRKIN